MSVIIVERLGDFYEAEGSSARLLHAATGCAMTKRDSGTLAGFPYNNLTKYRAQVEAAGHSLQIEESNR